MAISKQFHPRNRHGNGYDFTRLVNASPALKPYVIQSQSGQTSVDFSDEKAVRALNSALLMSDYGVRYWDIPDNYLCPPIPGRVDYIHHLADLLAESNKGQIPRGKNVRVLDIGTGANLVYPLIGQSEYGWQFTGVDIDSTAVNVASQIVKSNKLSIRVLLQKKRKNIFKGVIDKDDYYHLTLCNPPFHASAEAAKEGTQRKWRNLGKGASSVLNFGGQSNELWCPGGEVKFIKTMIEQSVDYAAQCMWFTCLVSKKDNLRPIKKYLANAKASEVKIVTMAQGQKVSRFIAWRFTAS